MTKEENKEDKEGQGEKVDKKRKDDEGKQGGEINGNPTKETEELTHEEALRQNRSSKTKILSLQSEIDLLNGKVILKNKSLQNASKTVDSAKRSEKIAKEEFEVITKQLEKSNQLIN